MNSGNKLALPMFLFFLELCLQLCVLALLHGESLVYNYLLHVYKTRQIFPLLLPTETDLIWDIQPAPGTFKPFEPNCLHLWAGPNNIKLKMCVFRSEGWNPSWLLTLLHSGSCLLKSMEPTYCFLTYLPPLDKHLPIVLADFAGPLFLGWRMSLDSP